MSLAGVSVTPQCKTVSILLYLSILFVMHLMLCQQLYAQGSAGRISGTVTDQSGGAVTGAQVDVTDVERGLTRSLKTDQAGEYVAPDLLPGMYTVHVEAAGFKMIEHTNIQLEVGKDVRVDAVLEPGAATSTVLVTAEVPMVDDTSATLGGTLSNETINDLPLNGRNYENLLQLRPGVTIYPGGGAFTQSTNGGRPDENVYLIEGLNNDEPFSGMSVINGATIAGDASTILPIDAIQEFNVAENPKAEYGWKPGAIVNVGLKSGENTVHGTAYAFGRSDAWDARNYFDQVGSPKQPIELQQYGATVGGPIKKDKLFYFLGYEALSYSVGSTNSVSAPVITSLGGDASSSLPDAIAGVQAAGLTPSALSLQLAGCTLGPPIQCTGNLFPANTGASTSFFPNLQSYIKENNGVAKVDYHINDHHTVSGMYFFGQVDGQWNDAPNQVKQQWESVLHTRAQVGSGSWIWTPSSRWVNEFRGGLDHLYQPGFGADHTVNPTTYGINTGVTNPLYFGFPVIRLNGFANFQLGAGGGRPRIQGPDEVYQILDHVSYLHGKHAFKFGGEFLRDNFTGASFTNARGLIRFGDVDAFAATCPPANSPCATTLEDFFAGLPGQGAILAGSPARHVHNEGYAVFFQDDYRIKPTLTLNLGLRYELNTVLKESNDQFGNFDPAIGLVQVGKQISAPYNGDHNNFAPRFGLAWDVRGDSKTVVRAGVGVVYDQLAYDVFLAQGSATTGTIGLGLVPTGAILSGTNGVSIPSPGTIATASVTLPGAALNWNGSSVGGASIFPTGQLQCGDGQGNDPGPCNTFATARNLRTPFVTTWTVDIERTLTKDLALEVGYVGNHGSKLVGVTDINQVDPNSAAEIACGHCEQAGRPFFALYPYLGYIDYLSNLNVSNYNGLQTTLTQRIWHGLTFTAAYTYSHALDEASANEGAGVPLDSTRPGLQYASSDFDVRHRFTLSTTYALPGRESWGQMLKGWQINSIVVLQSGQPWGPQDTSNDFSLTGEVNNPTSSFERWDFVGKPSDFTSNQNPIPYFSGPFPAACTNAANTPGLAASLSQFGCYAQGNSVLIPPAIGTYGTAGRNLFRDSGFRNWDLSIVKGWTFKERLTAQFRAEFFNILNHPNFANPYGGPNGYANNDPSTGLGFGCGCSTPDQAGTNPVLGSGSNRAIQLGLKLIF
jgi:Carboxypeptidase regulatory-like domain/TonB dependent receptor